MVVKVNFTIIVVLKKIFAVLNDKTLIERFNFILYV